MKKKLWGITGALAVLLALGFVLAGCATTGGSGSVPVPDKQVESAAKLAADLNAIKAGSAVVEGAKVTLAGEVRLTTGLIVPAGVTLDLTKEALELGDGAALTVDGTVDAKAEGIKVDSAAASPAIINGSGTINLKSKGRLLGIWKDKKLTLDGVTLVGLKDNDNSLVQVGEGGELVLKSGTITGNTRIGGNFNGAGVTVGGIFTMEGGTISGNASTSKEKGSGGGVFSNGTFTMTGGAITDNTSRDGGGLAYTGTFPMTGGEISGNTATRHGGGIRIFSEGDYVGRFTMEGGAIYGNTANGNGGGVSILSSTFTLKGGRIQGGVDSDGFAKNTVSSDGRGMALVVWETTTKWGTGGTYTKGGVPQSGGSDIVVDLDENSTGSTDETLIATPAK